MIDYEKGLYVTIRELPRGPHPMPLANGFNADSAYRVVGIYNPSETGECWFTLSNDRDELWFISQRHVRTFLIDRTRRDFRFSVAEFMGQLSEVAQLHQADNR